VSLLRNMPGVAGECNGLLRAGHEAVRGRGPRSAAGQKRGARPGLFRGQVCYAGP